MIYIALPIAGFAVVILGIFYFIAGQSFFANQENISILSTSINIADVINVIALAAMGFILEAAFSGKTKPNSRENIYMDLLIDYAGFFLLAFIYNLADKYIGHHFSSIIGPGDFWGWLQLFYFVFFPVAFFAIPLKAFYPEKYYALKPKFHFKFSHTSEAWGEKFSDTSGSGLIGWILLLGGLMLITLLTGFGLFIYTKSFIVLAVAIAAFFYIWNPVIKGYNDRDKIITKHNKTQDLIKGYNPSGFASDDDLDKMFEK